jgi:hypothetical protein
MVADDAVNQTSYGSLWWTFDKYGVNFTPLAIDRIRAGALKNYDILIMPDGSSGQYFSSLGKSGVESLKEWISDGGTLITLRRSSLFPTLKDVGLTTSVLVGSEADSSADKSATDEEKTTQKPNATQLRNQDEKPDKADDIPTLPPIVSPSANMGRVPEGVPGAIMRATVDRTTYLNYGINSNEMPVLLASGFFFRYSKEGTNALVFDEKPTKPLTISGFVWEGNTEKLLKGTAYLIDEPRGRGHTIMFADDIFFRGIFRANTRQFFNAILFNKTF